MPDTIDRNAAFKASSHTAKGPARVAADGRAKLFDSGSQDRRGDRGAILNLDGRTIYRCRDQSAWSSLDGK